MGNKSKKVGKVTIKDIAKETGYGLGTVSRALNGKGGVRAEVRTAVSLAVKKLGYRPNLGARAMRSKRFGNIAFFTNMSNVAFTRIAQGAQGYLKEYGYSMALCHIDDEGCIAQIEDYMRAQRYDGVMLSPNCEPSEALSRIVLSADLPYVLINREVPNLAGGIVIDYYNSVVQATEYLADLGHCGVLLLGGGANILPTSQAIDAYRAVRKRHNMSSETEYIAVGEISAEWGAKAVRTHLSKIQRGEITAILSLNNTIFFGAFKELRIHGIKYPEQVSLISFEDGQLLGLFDPPITAIARPLHEVGVRAARRLMTLLGNRDESVEEDEPIVIGTQLILRGSCGPALQK